MLAAVAPAKTPTDMATRLEEAVTEQNVSLSATLVEKLLLDTILPDGRLNYFRAVLQRLASDGASDKLARNAISDLLSFYRWACTNERFSVKTRKILDKHSNDIVTRLDHISLQALSAVQKFQFRTSDDRLKVFGGDPMARDLSKGNSATVALRVIQQLPRHIDELLLKPIGLWKAGKLTGWKLHNARQLAKGYAVGLSELLLLQPRTEAWNRIDVDGFRDMVKEKVWAQTTNAGKNRDRKKQAGRVVITAETVTQRWWTVFLLDEVRPFLSGLRADQGGLLFPQLPDTQGVTSDLQACFRKAFDSMGGPRAGGSAQRRALPNFSITSMRKMITTMAAATGNDDIYRAAAFQLNHSLKVRSLSLAVVSLSPPLPSARKCDHATHLSRFPRRITISSRHCATA